MLASVVLGKVGCQDGASQDQQQVAQKAREPAPEQAEIEVCGGENRVDAVAVAALATKR